MVAFYAFAPDLSLYEYESMHAMEKEATADDVTNALALYREYRRLGSLARQLGLVKSAARNAALAGVALRAMRRAAARHNGIV